MSRDNHDMLERFAVNVLLLACVIVGGVWLARNIGGAFMALTLGLFQ